MGHVAAATQSGADERLYVVHVRFLSVNQFSSSLNMLRSGNTISIFPIMMVAMMGWRPVKAILSLNAAFKPLEVRPFFVYNRLECTSLLQAEYTGTLILHKLVFAIGNIAAIVLAIYKCHSMGLVRNLTKA